MADTTQLGGDTTRLAGNTTRHGRIYNAAGRGGVTTWMARDVRGFGA